MPKKQRNKLGQFISSNMMAQKSNYIKDSSIHRFSALFMAMFLIFVASPWLTILVKLKKIRMIITSIVQFYNAHFIGEDEELTKLKCQRNGNDDI